MAEQLGEAVLTVSADTRQLEAGLQRARQQAEALRGAFAQLGVGLSFAGTLAFIGNQIKQLDSASAAVRTLGVNSDELNQRLRALSVSLGNNISQIQLTKAAYDVASSGFATASEATQVLKASAQGAQGGFAQLDDVVRAVTGVLNAYGLSADKATGIVDKFLQTQNDGVITVRQYAAEIGNIASIAAAGGVGLDQLNAAIATATLRGVPVAQTFTGLRQALSSIIKPSQQAVELAASLGLQFNVQALQAKGLAGVLTDVQQKTGGAADKIAILLGSVEAQAAVQPLLNDKLAKYNELLAKQAQSSGAAAEAAKINANTISGGLTQIGNGFSNLATTLDKALTPLFAGFINGLNEILTKLNQVAALAPDRVKSREREATRIVENAKQNSPNFNTRAFYGTPLVSPNTEIIYDGKTFKGTITGVRNDLVQYLLSKELNAGVGPEAITGLPKKQTNKAVEPSSNAGAIVSPSEQRLIQANAAIEMRGSLEKLAAAKELNQLDEASRVKLQNKLALNDKIRSIQQLQLQLKREQEKPVGTTGSPSELDPKKVEKLRNDIARGQVDISTQRIQNQQAEAAALRTQQDRVRQQQLELTLAQSKLVTTQQQTQLERDALATGQQVSATDLLRLRTQEAITQKLEQQKAAQQALQAELSKPKNQQDRVVVDDLLNKQARANADVRQAYADAGLALVQNARQAADALKAAEQSFNSTARGNFEFLTNDLQQQQIDIARQSVASGVQRGLIRGDADISSPEKLFRVAGVAESLVSAQDALKKALAENVKATEALVKKDWNIYLSTNNGAPQMLTPPPATPIKPQPVGGGPYGVWGGY